MSRKSKQSCDVTRREFVHASAAAAAALTLPGAPALVGWGRADTLRIGLVGCGGRGTGAAKDCLTSSERVELVAIGDLFPDRVTECRANLARMATEDTSGGLKTKIKLDDAHAFSGFDAYQKVIGSKVDVVLLATPPAFRARHLAAAIEAGKHVFMEKPVAVDPVEVRSVIASADLAAQKGLAIVAGTQRRHDAGYRAAMQRIHDGAIGDIVAAQVYWNQGGLWMKPRQPQWSDVEWQIRNWLYFTWLSGDHIVEQHIHNIDVANWALGAHPMKAVGVGGRQWRTDPAYGHIYDHFAIDFEYANGVHVLSMCRQIDGTASHVAERIVGTHGRSDGHSVIEGAAPWSWDAQTPRTNPYVQEHADLIASIRAGKPLNEGRQVAETTLSAIMGREAAYTGKEITWDELLNAEQDLVPADVKFGPMPVAPVAMPGQTVLARSWRSA
ncbi:MAG: oxidoreductase [Gemmatimonadetes bacterium]|nr:MAG: oxidoreductase [Gemmatimonadota bacterium]